MTISEKVAYIKGISELVNIEDPAKRKLIDAIVDVLGDIAKTVSDLQDETEYLDSYIEEIDEDLGAVEELLIDDEDEDDEDECDYDCDNCDRCVDCDEEDCERFADCAEVVCPSCGENVYIDDTMDLEKINCPSCGAEFSCACDGNCDGCDAE